LDTTRWLRLSGEKALGIKGALGKEKGWKPREDLRFLYDMECRCPWCGLAIPTGRVWMVSMVKKAVLRVWDIKTGTVIPWSRAHPHVHTTNGRMCMGDAVDVVQALTTAFNPNNPYWSVARFFKRLGHVCLGARDDNRNRGGMSWRLSSEPLPEEAKVAGNVACDHCDQWVAQLTRDTNYGDVCAVCMGTRFFYCSICGGHYVVNARYMETDRCQSCR
jgi:hypothetical protein